MASFAVAIFVLLLHLGSRSTRSVSLKKSLWILACCVVVLFSGLRSYHTGNDTIQYVTRFLSLQNYSLSEIATMEYRDLGFFYLVKIISVFTASPTVFLSVTSLLSLIGVFVCAQRYSNYPILVLFFYITLGNYLFLMTGIRQAIAMSICLLSMPFIEKRKIVPFVILVLIASAMHHSAIIFLPTYFLSKRQINMTNMIITIIITAIVYVFYDWFLPVINDIVGYNYEVEELNNGFIFYLVLLIILAYGYLNRSLWIVDDKQQIAMNLGIICVVIWTFRLIGRTAERPSMYWLNMVPVVLTNSICPNKNAVGIIVSRNAQIARIIAVLLSLILFFKRASAFSYSFFM